MSSNFLAKTPFKKPANENNRAVKTQTKNKFQMLIVGWQYNINPTQKLIPNITTFMSVLVGELLVQFKIPIALSLLFG